MPHRLKKASRVSVLLFLKAGKKKPARENGPCGRLPLPGLPGSHQGEPIEHRIKRYLLLALFFDVAHFERFLRRFFVGRFDLVERFFVIEREHIAAVIGLFVVINVFRSEDLRGGRRFERLFSSLFGLAEVDDACGVNEQAQSLVHRLGAAEEIGNVAVDADDGILGEVAAFNIAALVVGASTRTRANAEGFARTVLLPLALTGTLTVAAAAVVGKALTAVAAIGALKAIIAIESIASAKTIATFAAVETVLAAILEAVVKAGTAAEFTTFIAVAKAVRTIVTIGTIEAPEAIAAIAAIGAVVFIAVETVEIALRAVALPRLAFHSQNLCR